MSVSPTKPGSHLEIEAELGWSGMVPRLPRSSGAVLAFTAEHQDGSCERGLTPEAPSFVLVQGTAAFPVSFSPELAFPA